ncbi:hypothetical protein M405DRAFT_868300 [Rhizopogon salebrosus TDB-379]|nr:hypothetical protein M405DRAFT_868300 [Rhizopogon salebrosus TDB-379]
MWKAPNSLGLLCHCRSTGREIQIGAIGKLRIASWFDEYLVSSGKDRAIGKAYSCDECRSKVMDSMDRFRIMYVGQVKKVVAAVRLGDD